MYSSERAIPTDDVLALYASVDWWPDRTADEIEAAILRVQAVGSRDGRAGEPYYRRAEDTRQSDDGEDPGERSLHGGSPRAATRPRRSATLLSGTS
jgi:hypothetical protein